jgi:hypothetical protein
MRGGSFRDGRKESVPKHSLAHCRGICKHTEQSHGQDLEPT